jgi:hypothetical protein
VKHFVNIILGWLNELLPQPLAANAANVRACGQSVADPCSVQGRRAAHHSTVQCFPCKCLVVVFAKKGVPPLPKRFWAKIKGAFFDLKAVLYPKISGQLGQVK